MAHRRILNKIAVVIVYFSVWEIAALLIGSQLLFPDPIATITRLFALIQQKETWIAASLTMLRVLGGYAIGIILGICMAILTVKSPFISQLLSPLRGVIKATPVTSFILLALLWLTSTLVPTFIALLMVLPIVWSNVDQAIRDVDPDLLEMANAFRFSNLKLVKCIYIPAVLPQFLTACTTALGFAWKSGVAAEIITLPKISVGYHLYQSKLTLETVDLFAWTFLVIVLSMILEQVLSTMLRRIRHD